jgi:50S ribosomal subunit-associated GTPase HflX
MQELKVELAQCIYVAKIIWIWTHLERQKEELECVDLETEIETDRRIVRDRILLKR